MIMAKIVTCDVSTCTDSSLKSIDAAQKTLEADIERHIIRYLDCPQDIVPHLANLPLEIHREIFYTPKNETQKAVRRIISWLKSNSKDRWIETLADAIKKEYKGKNTLYCILQLDMNYLIERINQQAEYEQDLGFLIVYLLDLKVDDVMDDLIQEEVITMTDFQRIRCIQNNEGLIRAAQALLLMLPCRHPDFLVRLFRAMKKGKQRYSELFKDIHPRLSTAESSMSIREALTDIRTDLANRDVKSKDTKQSTPPKSSSSPGKLQKLDGADVETDASCIELRSSASVPLPPASAATPAQQPSTATDSFSFGSTIQGGTSTNLNQLSVVGMASRDAKRGSANNIVEQSPLLQRRNSDDNNANQAAITDSIPDDKDLFNKMISSAMSDIQELLKNYPEMASAAEDEPTLPRLANINSSIKHGSDEYAKRVGELQRQAAKIHSQPIRHFFESCCRHLQTYNISLMIRAVCRAKDSLEFIRSKFCEISSNRSLKNDPTDLRLDAIFNKMAGTLDVISRCAAGENSRLDQLTRVMLSVDFSLSPCLIICQVQDVAKCLVDWMKETPRLAELKPRIFELRHQANASSMCRGAMLPDLSLDARDQSVRVFVAWRDAVKAHSVDKLNVIEIAFDGRMTPKMLRGREDAAAAASRAEQAAQDDFKLKCSCGEFVVAASNIRAIPRNSGRKIYTVDDPFFNDRVSFEAHPNPKKNGKWETKDKMFCKKCHVLDWGVRAMYDGKKQFCLLTIKNLKVVDSVGVERSYDEWSNVPFPIKETHL